MKHDLRTVPEHNPGNEDVISIEDILIIWMTAKTNSKIKMYLKMKTCSAVSATLGDTS